MIKKILTLLILLCGITGLQAQPIIQPVKKIEVIGFSEKDVEPDIIYFSITLREYYKEPNQKNKKTIESLEKQLQLAVVNADIPSGNLTVDNIYGSMPNEQNKKNEPSFLAKKQYKLKLNDLSKINGILLEIDAKGIDNVHISELTHSMIYEYRLELKAQAMKDAQNKAYMMLSAIGEKLGEVLEVYDNDKFRPVHYAPAHTMMKSSELASDSTEPFVPEIDVKTIKIKSEARVIFQIK